MEFCCILQNHCYICICYRYFALNGPVNEKSKLLFTQWARINTMCKTIRSMLPQKTVKLEAETTFFGHLRVKQCYKWLIDVAIYTELIDKIVYSNKD